MEKEGKKLTAETEGEGALGFRVRDRERAAVLCRFVEFLTRRSLVTLNENSFMEADTVKQMLLEQRPTDFTA